MKFFIPIVFSVFAFSCASDSSDLEQDGFESILTEEGSLLAPVEPEKIEERIFFNTSIIDKKTYLMDSPDSSTHMLIIYDVTNSESPDAFQELKDAFMVENPEYVILPEDLENRGLVGDLYKGKSAYSDMQFLILDQNSNASFNKAYFMVVTNNGSEPDLTNAIEFFNGVEFDSYY